MENTNTQENYENTKNPNLKTPYEKQMEQLLSQECIGAAIDIQHAMSILQYRLVNVSDTVGRIKEIVFTAHERILELEKNQ